MADDKFNIGEAMLRKRLDEEEETDCGVRGRRCGWAKYGAYCDVHTAMGDDEYHAKRDKELEK
jgi:hypothetical protein